MFKSFFLNKQYLWWSILGTCLILTVTWYKVQLDVQINEWFGTFYNIIQTSLTTPNSTDFNTFLGNCLVFAKIAAIYIAVAVMLEFFVKHYIFRWRTAMHNFYMCF